ncbi:MAG TPA: two-component regulator propeller domain-containing protein [Candidatus Acidoferrales bacterium]|nr:two-component regulator propeller domain-containing protein [Candidatus Acidoferrales bacterium]
MSRATASSSYQFDVWQTDDGLPQGTVTSIVQTRDGYLWLGTQNGLVRFDGANFKVFNQNNTPAINNNRMVQLFVDHLGTLWVSGEEGELLCLREGRFRSLKMPGQGTPFNYARAICDDAQGNLWIVSCEWQLIRLGKDGFTVPSANWSLKGVQPDAVAYDPLAGVWVQTEQELAVLQNGTFQTARQETNEGNFRVYLAPSRQGGIWVAAEGRLRKFASGEWKADLGAYAWTNSPIYDLYEDSQNQVWVATMGSGLFRYSPHGNLLHLTTADGLPSNFVRCVKEDHEGNIWIGMESGGLCRLRPATFQSLGVRQGLSSDQVTSVCEATGGSFWIAMDGEGLDHLLSDGKVEHYGFSQGLLNGHVWSVVQDRQGMIWAGTWDGLYRRKADRFDDLTDGVNIGRVLFAIYNDRQGDLWLGQQGFGALTRLHGDEKALIKTPGATFSQDVRVMVQDSAGGFWVGTQNEGLYRWEHGQWTHFGKQEGLASGTVWALCADDDGTLWIGTCGGGLSRWQNGKITTWTTRNGLINDVICQILEDDKGNLWLGSYGGVFRVNKQQLAAGSGTNSVIQCTGYDKTDGLPSIECMGGFQPSGMRSSDGRLWFPTVKGFAIVDPDKVAHNLVAPPVAIDGVIVGRTTLLPEGDAMGLETLGSGLKVPPGKQHLEFLYTALSLTDPAKVRFQFRLEGLESGWNEAGARRTADYNIVPPGHYLFHVIACNNDGVWNTEGARLSVDVLPYFWQTRWFMALFGLTILGSVAGSVRFAVRRKLKRKIERIERERAIERERGRIANDIHDDLGAGLTEIVILSELAQNPDGSRDSVHADIRTVTDKARALTQSLDEIVWAVNPENDMLDNFVSYACNFVQEYLQLARIRCRLAVPSSLPDVPLTADIRHNLFMVIKEILNNIVKHAGASEVQVQIVVDSTRFALCIKDNGKGFRLEALPGGSAGLIADNPNRGLRRNGLANMRKRIQRIGGHLALSSQPGHGTQVELTVYLGKP